jgi:hypothetical protein
MRSKLMGSDTNPWLAIYDIECDNPMAFLGAIGLVYVHAAHIFLQLLKSYQIDFQTKSRSPLFRG